MTIKATSAYEKHDISTAFDLCVKIIAEDPLKLEIMPVYCCCLLEKQDCSELYKISVMLMNNYPEEAVSYYAVGLYQILIEGKELARKYFNKANSIDKNFFYSWIAIGHTYALVDENENVKKIQN